MNLVTFCVYGTPPRESQMKGSVITDSVAVELFLHLPGFPQDPVEEEEE